MRFPDGLRAVAALLVILPHATGMLTFWPAPSAFTRFVLQIAPLGRLGVQIFFVLSGFVIAYTLRESKLSLRYVGTFLLRRSVRLDPPYWVAILLYVGMIAARRYAGHEPALYPTGAQLLAHLF